jgi:hypothetical protein
MYNLNYNVTNARLNRPVGRPFVPTPRFDAFSSSLVLAIPGAIFKNGYVNVFNQVNEYDDISAYIVSGSILDEETNAYFPLNTTQSVSLTGSLGFYSASVAVNNFANQDYRTSLFFTGSIAAKIAAAPGNGTGLNLTASKSFTIECWAAFPQTASFATASGGGIEPIIVVNPRPNRILAKKYKDGDYLSSTYAYEIGWTGDTAFGADLKIVSGSSIFYMDNEAFGEQAFNPATSSVWTPYQWKHYAVSYTANTSSLYGTVRQYINGVLIAQEASVANMIYAPTTPTLLFGDEEFYGGTPASSSQIAGAFFQDFRMYNGTNKNYTGSQFTPPESMVIGVKQPYPQYNP